MNKNLTELVFILDKSGSMCGLEQDTIGGFNSLIEKQKKEEGEVVVSTVLFNQEMTFIHNRVDINEVSKMTTKEYFTGGCTALLDAMGNTIKTISEKQEQLKDEYKPNKTMVIITTDGLENASTEYNFNSIKRLISKQTELGWEFIYLGANIDAVKEAARVGIRAEMAVNYNCDSEGLDINYSALSSAISEMKTKGCVSQKWRRRIDLDYQKRGKRK